MTKRTAMTKSEVKVLSKKLSEALQQDANEMMRAKSNRKEQAVNVKKAADRIARMKARVLRLEALVKKYDEKGKAARGRLAMVRGRLAQATKAKAAPKEELKKAA